METMDHGIKPAYNVDKVTKIRFKSYGFDFTDVKMVLGFYYLAGTSAKALFM